ncbi:MULTISPECIES: ATP-dependent Clp protease adapter ClpS [unclassified Microbacterium]|uniref:ATP-dependent Clp protease adapter ClpS n=1 Tax=unclassified Microbacterium TaxID=2609290 RepID=UPI003744CCB0
MGLMSTSGGTELIERTVPVESSNTPWQTVVWNDPVNLMSYVARVFREYFGFDADLAHRLMMSVHRDGFAVVAEGVREQMEMHAQAMHDYGLWATVRPGGAS